MEEVNQEISDLPLKRPKVHIWNKILEEDELAEALGSSMKCHGFPRAVRPKKKKKKKNKKNKTTPVGQPNQNNTTDKSSHKKPKKIPYSVLTEEAKKICSKLKEKRYDLITRSIRSLGLEEVHKLITEVMTIEEAGGLMTMNGKRRRSPGGVFFHLIKNSGRYDETIVKKILKENEINTNETSSNFAKAKKIHRSQDTKKEVTQDKLEAPQDVKFDSPQSVNLEIAQDVKMEVAQIEPEKPVNLPDIINFIPLLPPCNLVSNV